MEQKKILWIIVSVAVFLCVVFTAGLLWFYPSKDVQTAEAGKGGSGQASIDFDPVEWVRNSADYPGLNPSENKEKDKTDEFTIVYGEADSNTENNTVAGNAPSVVSVPAADTVKAPARAPVEKTSAKPEITAKTSVKETAAVAAPAQPKRPVAEYWIQAGSFTSRSSAESAKRTLAEENISSRITIKTINGTDYYRVRIGPYANRQEAEKFLKWVKQLDAFDGSYISKVTVMR